MKKVGYGYGNEWVARFHILNIIREYEEIVTKSQSCAKNCLRLINCLFAPKCLS
jgi:hypothetical protein